MPVGLRGDHRLLHARQKLLRLGQRQPQMRDIAKVAGRPDLHDVDTRSGAISLRFDQPQNPPHPRSPGRQRPNGSYRLRPHPPTFWTLPACYALRHPPTCHRVAWREELMRLLAIHPGPLMYTKVFLRLEPLGLELVAAAALRDGHDVA